MGGEVLYTMTAIRMSVATVTASLATKISLCAVIVYNHCLGRHKWRYTRSIKPAPGEMKRREVELGFHSRMDCLVAELFLNSCFSDTVFVTVLHSCCNSNYPPHPPAPVPPY